MTGPDTPVLYTAAEAAVILRVKKSWLERQAATRKVPFTMLGRSYRFTPAHIAIIVEIYEHAPAVRRSGPARSRPRNSPSPADGHAAAERPLQPRPGRRPGGPRGAPRH